MSQETIGERLRRARERTGATLMQASHATKIRPDFIQAMERDSFGFVSGKTYVRGLLIAYVRWLRLDAGQIGAEFDGTYGPPSTTSLADLAPVPATPAPRKPRSSWIGAAAVAAGLLLVLSLAGLLKTGTETAAPPPIPDRNQLGQQSAAPQSPSVLAEAPTTAAPDQPQGVNLVVAAVGDRSWIRVEIDGRPGIAFQGILGAGDSRTFQGDSSVKVTFGNLAPVRLTMNGRDLGRPGAPGQTVGTFTFTPDSAPFAPS
ncbi:MAG: helix-turn-helix domain-containing protein [Actinomycetota bacterium]